jgi:hypothetical protein
VYFIYLLYFVWLCFSYTDSDHFDNEELTWTVSTGDGRIVNLLSNDNNPSSKSGSVPLSTSPYPADSSSPEIKRVMFEERFAYCDAAEALRLSEGFEEVVKVALTFYFFLFILFYCSFV